jgi:putative restriction endonuclease
VRAYVGVTDRDWYGHLRLAGTLGEVNFWQLTTGGGFKTLLPGEIFLFKLHSPDDFIVGGGPVLALDALRVSFAWEASDRKNGASNLPEMRARIERYRKIKPAPHEDYEIGCIVIHNPFFFERDDWVPARDWQPNVVRGTTYDLTSGAGQWLGRRFRINCGGSLSMPVPPSAPLPGPRYGAGTRFAASWAGFVQGSRNRVTRSIRL